MTPITPHEALRMLEWSLAMGADDVLADDGLNRFALPPPAAPADGLPLPPALPLAERAALSARERAKAASGLAELRTAIETFEDCGLKASAMKTVFADGNPQARVMFIGEAPGRDEDIQGLPFVGKSGQLLDRMLAAIGLDRTTAYISNVIPWRPPGNRDPTPQEVQTCLPFIERHIELVRPQIIVTLGKPSAAALTGRTDGIMKLRGQWLRYERDGLSIPVLVMLHPAFLLRQPGNKRFAWRDMLALKKRLTVPA